MDTEIVSLIYHYLGRWVHTPALSYIEGCELVEKRDIDFLSFTHMLKKYKEEFNMSGVSKLQFLIPRETCDKGLVMLENDDGINEMVGIIRSSTVESNIHIYPVVDEVEAVAHLSTQTSVIKSSDQFGGKGSTSNLESELLDEADQFMKYLTYSGEEDLVMGDNEVVNVQHVHNEEELSGLESDSDSVEDHYQEFESQSSETDVDLESEVIDLQLIKQSSRKVNYNIDDNNPHFMLGMSFGNAREARLAIARYSVAKCTPLTLRPNQPDKIRAKCKTAGCPFYLYISRYGEVEGMVVKRIDDVHTCMRDAKNNLASAKFLANEFKNRIYENPNTTCKDLMYHAEKEMRLYVSKSKCKRAKRIVKTELDGSYVAEHAYLGAYIANLKKTNPGSTAELELCAQSMKDGRIVFKRLYICFDALKRDWKAGCRPIIGIDGCHLKGVIKGQILTAVGKDGNDQIFPIAWAVISKENKDNWIWFLQLLVQDLEIEDHGNKLTIISDMQKGLVQAVSHVLPDCEHRYCARHVHANWSKKWRSEELKKRFWTCAWSTYKEEFEDNLKHLANLSKQAAEDFVSYNPQTFCRAFFSSRCKSPMVDNNFCESFNFTILTAREKPIVSMLNEIRRDAMEMMASHKASVEKWTSEWSPNCMKVYQNNMDATFGCMVSFNGADGYEIGDGEDSHTVFLAKQLCTCRAWDLSGIPCSHAICAMNHSKMDPKAFISHWYHRTTYMLSYQHAMQPMQSKKFMNCDSFVKVEPPPVQKMSGRPRTKRMRSSSETVKGKTCGKWSKKGILMKCSICRSVDHNRASCPSKPSQGASNELKSTSQNIERRKMMLEKPKNKAPEKEKSQVNHQSQHKTCFRKTRRPVGLGIYIDEASGNMTLNPGTNSETIITQRDPVASQPLDSNPDPVTRGAILNEMELRRERRFVLSSSSCSRKIGFVGDGSKAIAPTNLPFKQPGLKWKGKDCMTTRQLLQAKDNKMAKK